MMLPEPQIRWCSVRETIARSLGRPDLAPTNDDCLREMCDYGARAFANGKSDALEFRCMGNEAPFIRRYMEEAHPAIPYRVNHP